MSKKLLILPVALFGLVLSSCGGSGLKDNFTAADQTVDTPWVDYVMPATNINFKEGEDQIVLKKGETHAYQYEIQPRGSTANSITWFSNDENVATVNQGVVTAVGGGNAVITAALAEADPVELNVDVVVPLTSFALEVPNKLEWDSEYQFNVTYEPSDTTERDLKYEISEVSVAGLVSVNEQGLIKTTNQNGTAKLKVSGGENIVKEYTLNINSVAVSSVTLADGAHELEVNHTLGLAATVLPADAIDIARKGVKYHSLNPEIARVDEVTGIVLGVTPGNTQVYAQCGDVLSAYYAIEVFKVNATAVAINTPAFTLTNAVENSLTKQLEYGLTLDRAGYDQPSDATISFSSSNERVATVNEQGLVTAIGPGNAEIKIKVIQPDLAVLEDSVTVTVNIVSTTLTINGGNSFYNDSTLALSAALTPANVSNDEITWSLEQNTANVSLSATTGAIVTLIPDSNEVGTVKVKATNTNGASNEITVTVMEREAEFTAGHHYIVGNALYNTGESVRVDGKSSWTNAKYAYHFTYSVADPTVYEQFKGTIKFQAGDQFKYFVGSDYWVPAWEQQEGWAERGYHIQQDGTNNAFIKGQMKFVKENENHQFVDSDAADANIEVVEAGYYDLYAKLYKNDDGSLWYSLYIEKVPNLHVEVSEITMGLEEAYQIKAHDWIGDVSYSVKSGADLITLSPTGLVTGKGVAGTAIVTVNDDRNVPVDVTFTLKDGAHAGKIVYLNANGMFDSDSIVPFVHSWGDEGASAAADVPMEKVEGQNIIYTASIPLDHTKIDFVRCPEGTTELVWDYVYNQSKDQDIPNDKDMFTMTGWLDEKDGRNNSYVGGEWSVFDSTHFYEIEGLLPPSGNEDEDINGNSYLMYGHDPMWNYLPLVDNPGDSGELMCSIDLEANTEFVIKAAEGDWRHFENNKDASADEVVQGTASNLEETEHNFKASAAGTYSFYILKDKAAEGGKTVYVGFSPAGGELPPAVTYTVSFDANGGTGTKAPVEGVSGSYTLPDGTGLTAPENKQFAGWAFTATGEVITSATIEVSQDVTLFAVWENEHVANNVTLYLTANWDGWESPKAYVYNSSTETYKVAWPGENMNYVGVNDDNDTIFSYTVDIASYDKIIFHNGYGGDGNQTESIDISTAVDKDAYYLKQHIDADESKNIVVEKWGTFSEAALTSKQIIYFTNNKGWSDVKFYVFNAATSTPKGDWPGEAAKWVFKNGDNQDVYRLLIDTTAYDSFIFNGSGGKTVDILVSSLTGDNNAFYLEDTMNGEGYNVGQWKYNPLA